MKIIKKSSFHGLIAVGTLDKGTTFRRDGKDRGKAESVYMVCEPAGDFVLKGCDRSCIVNLVTSKVFTIDSEELVHQINYVAMEE